jgi:hypothetical protein
MLTKEQENDLISRIPKGTIEEDLRVAYSVIAGLRDDKSPAQVSAYYSASIESVNKWFQFFEVEIPTGASSKGRGRKGKDLSAYLKENTGRVITPKIVAQGNSSASTCAATYCSDYSYGGYSDWFLPSKDEMSTLYTNRVAVSSSISTSTSYWTCSEDTLQTSGSTYGRVWTGGSGAGVTGKNNSYLVRPVRAFSASAFVPIYAVGGSDTNSSSATAGGNSVFEGGLEYSADLPTSSGGGGTSAVGQDPYYTSPNYYSGNGGAGSTWNSFKSFGGGGGAGGYYTTGYYTINNRGTGGTTGGGAGSDPTLATPIAGGNGTANTGGGGGGGSFKDYSTTSGGSGGSGVVIVRYLL